MTKMLLIGSGLDATQARSWDLSNWVVAAIHNAWSIVPDALSFHVVSGDFIPAPGNQVPVGWYAEQGVTPISYDVYDSKEQHARYGRQRYGIGATMFFNAAYWCLSKNPSTLGFVGCSMDYPTEGPKAFYGDGKPDPLRFREGRLLEWFDSLSKQAIEQHCELFNFGSGEGVMPYPHHPFTH